MIVLSVGLPGRFAEWCEALLFELAAVTLPQPQIFSADTLEGIGHELLTRACGSAVVVVRQPSIGLKKTLLDGKTPFLLLLEDPLSCAAALAKDHDYDASGAIRYVANSCAAGLPLLKTPCALVLRAEEKLRSLETAQAISKHFGFTLEAKAIAAIVALPHIAAAAERAGQASALPAVALGTKTAEAGAARPLSPELLELSATRSASNTACDALDPLRQSLEDGELREIIWHRELFFHGDQPSAPLPAIIDVTGPARCLAFGPYIRLPEGSWSCSLMLGCSENALGLSMNVEVFTDIALNRAKFELSEAGLFEIEFSFVLANADVPVQIRLFNADAAFEGEVALLQARMSPLTARRLPVNPL